MCQLSKKRRTKTDKSYKMQYFAILKIRYDNIKSLGFSWNEKSKKILWYLRSAINIMVYGFITRRLQPLMVIYKFIILCISSTKTRIKEYLPTETIYFKLSRRFNKKIHLVCDWSLSCTIYIGFSVPVID